MASNGADGPCKSSAHNDDNSDSKYQRQDDSNNTRMETNESSTTNQMIMDQLEYEYCEYQGPSHLPQMHAVTYPAGYQCTTTTTTTFSRSGPVWIPTTYNSYFPTSSGEQQQQLSSRPLPLGRSQTRRFAAGLAEMQRSAFLLSTEDEEAIAIQQQQQQDKSKLSPTEHEEQQQECIAVNSPYSDDLYASQRRKRPRRVSGDSK